MNPSNQPCFHAGEILIVDDVPENLHFLAALLRPQGYRIRCVTSGKAALRSAKFEPPDLILLDINMPDMNGYEVCQQLKADAVTEEIPVVFASALNASSQTEQVLAAGGVGYIAKPFQIQDVLTKIRKALHRLPLLLV